MAITRAQQVKQMLRDGGVTEDIGFSIVKPSKDGRRPGYRFGDRGYQGGPSSRDVERPGGGGRGRDRDFQQRGESKEKYQETSKEYRDRGTQQVYGRSQLSQQQKCLFVPSLCFQLRSLFSSFLPSEVCCMSETLIVPLPGAS